MENYITHTTVTDKAGKPAEKDKPGSKLYVAYINHAATNDTDIYDDYDADMNCYKACTYVVSDISGTGKRIPVILSQEDELKLFNEYY